MARFDLSGKVALVAGASRGIGAAIAHAMAEQGAHVICSSRRVEDCQKVADEIIANGGKASAMTLHLGVMQNLEDAITAIEQAHGRLIFWSIMAPPMCFTARPINAQKAPMTKPWRLMSKGRIF